MKKIWLYLSVLLCMLFTFSGCDAEMIETYTSIAEQQLEAELEEEPEAEVGLGEAEEPEIEVEPEAAEEPETEVEPEAAEEPEEELPTIDENGAYTSRDEVALYLHTYGELPQNFITKKEAQQLGWDSKKGNLHDVAPGMSIGGDRFGNYERILPDNDYKECDINYSGGYRGDERIVFSDDGDIYYTDDHYASFIQLY